MGSRKELMENYWRILRRTRRSGRISQSVIDKEEKYWSRYPDDVVDEALRIHINRYPDHKECYTRGIMRNLAKQKEKGRKTQKNDFCSFPQRDYDFDTLEKRLVNNMQEDG